MGLFSRATATLASATMIASVAVVTDLPNATAAPATQASPANAVSRIDRADMTSGSAWSSLTGSWNVAGGKAAPKAVGENLAVTGSALGGDQTVTGSVTFATPGVWGGIAANVVASGPGGADYFALRMKQTGTTGIWQLVRMSNGALLDGGIVASGGIFGGTGSSYGLSLTVREGGGVIVRITHADTNAFRQELTLPASLRIGAGRVGVYAMHPSVTLSGVSVTSDGSAGTDDYQTNSIRLARWYSSNGELHSRGGSSATNLDQGVSLANSFAVRASVLSNDTGGRSWVGIAFNSTSSGRYVLRYSRVGGIWQLVDESSTGATSVLSSGLFASGFNAAAPVTLIVSRGSVGSISLGAAQGVTQLLNKDITLPSTGYRDGGRAGVWSLANSGASFDAFSAASRDGFVPLVSAPLVGPASQAIGTDWRQLSGQWQQTGSGITAALTGSSGALVTRGGLNPQVISGYALAVTVKPSASSGWVGIASGVTSAGAYTSLQVNADQGRWRVIQVLPDGSTSLLATGSARYLSGGVTLTVVSDGVAGNWSVSGVSGSKQSFRASVPAGSVPDGGHPGLYSAGTGAAFSNFTYQVAGNAPLDAKPAAWSGAWNAVTNPSAQSFTPKSSSLVPGSVAVTLPIKTYALSSTSQGIATSPDGKTQVVAIYDETGRIAVGKRSLVTGPNTPFGSFVRLNDPQRPAATQGNSDVHNGLSIGFDPKGNIHISGNMHATQLVYFKTTTPGDLSTFVPVHNLVDPTTEQHVSYPMFVTVPATSTTPEHMVFMFRSGFSGDGQQTFYTTYDGVTWKKIPLTIGGESNGETYSAYFANGGMPTYRDGWFYLAWNWRQGTGGGWTGTQVMVARSRDLTQWQSLDGKVLPDNITASTARTFPALEVDALGSRTDGTLGLGFDASGNVLVAYSKFDNDDLGPGINQQAQYEAGWGQTQSYVARWTSTGWYRSQITNTGMRWSTPAANGATPSSFEVYGIAPVTSALGKLASWANPGTLMVSLHAPGLRSIALDPVTLQPTAEGPGHWQTSFISSAPPEHMGWVTSRDKIDADGNQFVMTWAAYPLANINGHSTDWGQPWPANPQPVTVRYSTQ